MLNNFSIKARLVFLTASFGVLLVVIGLLGNYAMVSSEEDLEVLYDQHLSIAAELSAIKDNMQSGRTQILLSLQHDPKTEFAAMHDHPMDRHQDLARKTMEQVTEEWRHAQKLMTGSKDTAVVKSLDESVKRFTDEGMKPAIELLQAGKFRDANAVLLSKINASYAPAAEALDKLMALEFAAAKELHDHSVESNDKLQFIFITLLTIGITLNGALAFATVSGINRGTREIEHAAARIADGDLNINIQYDGKDELGVIAKDIRTIAENLRRTLERLSAATSQLAAAAEQTSAVTRDTNANIRRQQSETDQVATAMNEMNATVHEVAKSASNAATAAHAAESESSNGKIVVGKTIEVIDNLAHDVEQSAAVIRNLAKESENIGTVLDVIRGIAEQTNLLALNAAIEAARAGEQGRGFAVVADEVRTLASRTQQSTQEIQGMIQRLQTGTADAVRSMEKSRTQAQAGVGQAAATGTSLDAILTAVRTINDMNTQIASASEEQSAVAEEINKNITNISDVAVHTAEGSAQTAAASEQLAKLAEELQSLVGRFRL